MLNKDRPSFLPIFITLLLVASSNCWAQSNLDSLENILPQLSGKARVDVLNNLGFSYGPVSIEKAYHYAFKGLEASKKLNYNKGEIESLINIGYSHLDYDRTDSAHYYFNEAIGKSNQFKLDTQLAKSYNGLANAYMDEDEYSTAITYFKKALRIHESLGNAPGMATSLKNIGAALQKTGQYGNAADYLVKSLKINREHNLEKSVAKNLLAIAFNYINQAEGDLTLDTLAYQYLKEAEGMPIMQQDLRMQINLYNQLALVYKKYEDHDRSISYYEKAIEISEKLGDSPAIPLQNLAVVYMSKGDYQRALALAEKVLKMKREIGRKSSICYTLDLYAKTYISMGEFEKAIPYSLESLDISKSLGAINRTLQPYEFLSEAYAGLEQYDKAWDFRLKYENIKDSLFNARKAQQQTSMISLYETEMKQQTIELQEANLKTQEASLALSSVRNNQLTYGIIGAAILAFSFVLSFLWQRKNNHQLNKQKRIIEIRNQEKEVLLKEIHHRVKNNLQIISSILNIQARNLDDPHAKTAVAEGRSRIKSMSLIHEKLYNNNQLSFIDMKEYIEELSTFLFKTYKPAGEIHQRIEAEDLKLDIDTAIPLGLILNELISNSLKYAFEGHEKGELSISFAKEQEEFTLQVADSGVGLPANFNEIKNMGMRLVNSLTEQIDGILNINTGHGTTFTIKFKPAK